jgi:HlyD family secretion protein
MKSLIFSAIFLGALAAGGGAFWNFFQRGDDKVAFRTEKIERGDLIVTVGATGTLEPEELVDVGAQVVGRIEKFGDDPRAATDPEFEGKHVDYNTPVEEGTVLAEIDESVYLAQRNQARAALARAKADLIQLKAQYAQAEAEWNRAQKLRNLDVKGVSANELSTRVETDDRPRIKMRAISDADFILAKSRYEVSKANIDVGQAAIEQQQSALDLAETNLGYTVIKSPVRGTIIDRRVNIGQTVVASLNAPSLFLIAKDLRRIQVWASVNEADIGELKVGTPVTFTVETHHDEVFLGAVLQVRLNAKMTQNVVTYTIVVETDNSDLKLRPYQTAEVKFEIARHDNVLSVPNGALRYQPRPELISKDAAATFTAADPVASEDAVPEDKDKPKTTGVIWARKGSRVMPIQVELGASDGARTEVTGPGVEEGVEIVMGELDPGEAAAVNNPFAPNFRRGQQPPRR